MWHGRINRASQLAPTMWQYIGHDLTAVFQQTLNFGLEVLFKGSDG